MPHLNVKCQQRIDLQDGFVLMPHFRSDTTLSWIKYHVAAVAFHIGHCATSGHWRTALLFHRDIWYESDDGALLDRMTHLTNSIQEQIQLIWLIKHDLDRIPAAAVDLAEAPAD